MIKIKWLNRWREKRRRRIRQYDTYHRKIKSNWEVEIRSPKTRKTGKKIDYEKIKKDNLGNK